jgi:hypothetical protein
VLGLSSFAALEDADVLVSDVGLPSEARRTLSKRVGELLLVNPADGAVQAG